MYGKGGQGVFKGELRPKVELCFENLLDQIANFGRLVFVTLTFHIAHLNRHTQMISGVPLKLTWCQRLVSRALQNQETQICAKENRPI